MLNGFVNLLTNINTSSVILTTLTTPATTILRLGMVIVIGKDYTECYSRLTFTAAFNLMKVLMFAAVKPQLVVMAAIHHPHIKS